MYIKATHNLEDFCLCEKYPVAIQTYYPVLEEIMTTYRETDSVKHFNNAGHEYVTAVFRLKPKTNGHTN